MEKHTDESVQTGLQIESNKDLLKEQHAVPGPQDPVGGQKKNNAGSGYKDPFKETDADELVHEDKDDVSTGHKEQDPDELVHSSPAFKTLRDNDEVDPDDLVQQSTCWPTMLLII